ncbi:MAG: hypothetical protein K2O67_00870, partial [Clostridia bacterium]|nr:hypothetical protein [Clostridia bacterium]
VCLTASNSIKFLERIEFDAFYKKKISTAASPSSLHRQVVHCGQNTFIYAFTNLGNCVKIDLSEVEPADYRSVGVKLEAIADGVAKGEYPVKIFAVNDTPQGDVLFYTKQGTRQRTQWSEYMLTKRVFPAIKLKDGDEVLNVENFDEDEFSTMLLVTKKALCLNAVKDDVPVQGRVAGGVRGISLNDGDEVIFATQQNGEGEVIIATTFSTFKRVISSLFDPHGRGSKGMMIADIKGKGDILYADYVTVPYKLAVMSADKTVTEIDTESINIEPRVSRGKPLAGINNVVRVVPLKYKSEFEGNGVQLKF